MVESSLVIALGGALGSLGRFWMTEAFVARLQSSFPWGTLVVNISGCFIIGLFSALTGPHGRYPVSSLIQQFVMIGICGGYTTFSSFSLQTLQMVKKNEWLEAGLYIIASVFLCLLAVWCGAVTANSLSATKIF